MHVNSFFNHPFFSHLNNPQSSADQAQEQSERQASNNATANQDSVTKLNPGNLNKVLHDKVVGALEQALSQTTVDPIYKMQSEDLMPDKVASRVLGFIAQALHGLERKSEDFNNKLAEARHGIEKGFNEAKDILMGLGAYNGNIAENAEKTYTALQHGLDKISSSQVEAFHSRQVSLRQSVDIQVQTKDGDLVTIQVKNNYGAGESTHAQRSDDAFSINHKQNSYASEKLSYSIEGDLDEDELSAIEDLVGKINNVSASFFEGDVQAAFEQAHQLGFDTHELASYSMSVRETQQTRVTSAYRTVEQLNDNNPRADFEPMLQPLKNFLNDFSEAFQQTERSPMIPDSRTSFVNLFTRIPLMHADTADQISQMEKSGQSFNKIVTDLLERA